MIKYQQATRIGTWNESTLMQLKKGDVSLNDRSRDLALHKWEIWSSTWQMTLLGFVLPAFRRPSTESLRDHESATFFCILACTKPTTWAKFIQMTAPHGLGVATVAIMVWDSQETTFDNLRKGIVAELSKAIVRSNKRKTKDPRFAPGPRPGQLLKKHLYHLIILFRIEQI